MTEREQLDDEEREKLWERLGDRFSYFGFDPTSDFRQALVDLNERLKALEEREKWRDRDALDET